MSDWRRNSGGFWRRSRSCEDSLDDRSGDVGETVIAALKTECEAGVIDAEAVEDRGVEVVDMNRVRDHVVGKFVSGTMRVTRLDATTCEPDCEAAGMVVAPIRICRELSLAVDRAAE